MKFFKVYLIIACDCLALGTAKISLDFSNFAFTSGTGDKEHAIPLPLPCIFSEFLLLLMAINSSDESDVSISILDIELSEPRAVVA